MKKAMFRYAPTLAAGFFAMVLATALPAAEQFARSITDLPLMPGLAEQAESTVVFDKPNGRIVEFTATGAVDPEAVIGFYAETLPQLGWRQEQAAPGAARFMREREILSISVAPGGDVTAVQFSLAPR